MSVAHLFVRSVASRENFYLLKQTVTTKNFDIFTVSESWLDLTVCDADILIPRYTTFRHDRGPHKRGGGVLVYVKDIYKACVIEKWSSVSESNFQQLWLKVQCKKFKSFLLCTVYRPPDAPIDFLENLSETFVDSLLHGSNVIIRDYVLVCTTNPQILTVICCIHHPTHPMSKIPFPILNFLDSDVCAVMTLILLTNLKKCASFLKNVAILLLSFKQTITALNKLIDSQHYKRHKRKRMTEFQSPSHFTLSNPVKAIILNNFKILQTGAIFSQPPLISFKRDKNVGNFPVRSTFKTIEKPGTFKCARSRCKTCPFVQNTDKISGPKRSVKISDRFTCTSANVIYCITCTLCKKRYIGETGRRLGDRFREHLRDVEKDGKDASKPVARHFNLPNHSKEHMSVCGLSLHQGTTDSRKNLEQRFIFQIGTLNPHGIN